MSNSVYLAHHGIKGMKWGIRRYQNSDGTLTNAGKKRLTRKITSRKTSTIDAHHIATEEIRSNKELGKWRDSESYKKAMRAKSEYIDAKEKYLDAEDKVWRGVIDDIENKYGGRYQDIVDSGDAEKMSNFKKDYDALLDDRFKKNGIYDLQKAYVSKYEALEKARTDFQKDTRAFVEQYLGKYGDASLKGQGSAIYRGQNVVDRVKTSDIFIESFSDIDRIGMSWKDRK